MRQKIPGKLLTKTFAFGQICHKFRWKNLSQILCKAHIQVKKWSNCWSLSKKTFAFERYLWFRVLMVIIFKGRNFRENDQKTQKTQNLMPAKVSALNVVYKMYKVYYFKMNIPIVIWCCIVFSSYFVVIGEDLGSRANNGPSTNISIPFWGFHVARTKCHFFGCKSNDTWEINS